MNVLGSVVNDVSPLRVLVPLMLIDMYGGLNSCFYSYLTGLESEDLVPTPPSFTSLATLDKLSQPPVSLPQLEICGYRHQLSFVVRR